MKKAHKRERIVTMHQMLFEMARGNFHSRIPLSSHDDELETLVVLLNMVAEEMEESYFNVGFLNTHKTDQFITQTTLVMDFTFSIKTFTPEISCFLGYGKLEMLGMGLADIITAASFEQLRVLVGENVLLPTTIVLDFKPKDHLPVSISCSIGKLFNRSEIIVNLVTPIDKESYNPLPYKNEKGKYHKTRKADALLIQKLYDYILANLEEPLPSLRELSNKFGTNEHKLKEGFRHFFKTSIYKFYNDERLKRAYFMIENTTIPLKNVSVMNGFNNYPNFSKSFKKRFGFSPNEIQRNDSNFSTLPNN